MAAVQAAGPLPMMISFSGMDFPRRIESNITGSPPSCAILCWSHCERRPFALTHPNRKRGRVESPNIAPWRSAPTPALIESRRCPMIWLSAKVRWIIFHELTLAGNHGPGGLSRGLPVLRGLPGRPRGRLERQTSHRPIDSATTSTTSQHGDWYCSAFTLPQSLGQDRWSDRCWRRNGDIFPASPGSSSGPVWQAGCMTL